MGYAIQRDLMYDVTAVIGCASHSSRPLPPADAPDNDIFKMCWELHDEITDENNHLTWEEICGTLEDIAEASKKHDAVIAATVEDRIKSFYVPRMNELQKYQKELPEPHRTAICNILANGRRAP